MEPQSSYGGLGTFPNPRYSGGLWWPNHGEINPFNRYQALICAS